MSNRFWLTSDLQQRRRFGVRKSSSWHRTQPLAVRLLFGATLIALVLLLSACHTLPTKPCPEHKLPTPPALSLQAPKASYSISARTNIEAWRKMLTEQSQTGKP